MHSRRHFNFRRKPGPFLYEKNYTQMESKKKTFSLLPRGLIASCVNHSDFSFFSFLFYSAPRSALSFVMLLFSAVDTKQAIYNRDRDGAIANCKIIKRDGRLYNRKSTMKCNGIALCQTAQVRDHRCICIAALFAHYPPRVVYL